LLSSLGVGRLSSFAFTFFGSGCLGLGGLSLVSLDLRPFDGFPLAPLRFGLSSFGSFAPGRFGLNSVRPFSPAPFGLSRFSQCNFPLATLSLNQFRRL
jgi:hypothetical protein